MSALRSVSRSVSATGIRYHPTKRGSVRRCQTTTVRPRNTMRDGQANTPGARLAAERVVRGKAQPYIVDVEK